MEIALHLAAPTQPVDAGIERIVTAEALRVFRALTSGGSQAVSIAGTATVPSYDLAVEAVDGGDGDSIDVSWTDIDSSEVLAYVIFAYDNLAAVDGFNVALPGDETSNVTVSGTGTFTVDVFPVFIAPATAVAEPVVVAAP